MRSPLTLPPDTSRALHRLANDLARVFGPRFVALVAYGPAASLAFAESVTAADLEACGALVETWQHDGLATPLLLSEEEFRRSLDTFPLEYQAILDHHLIIAGRDPFAGCEVAAADLRRACEVQARGHLIHLRQGWIEAGSHDHAQSQLVARSAAPLRALLANVARLQGATVSTVAELASFAEREAGMSAALVRDVLALEGVADPGHRAAHLLPAYLEAANRLWAFVDAWKSHART